MNAGISTARKDFVIFLKKKNSAQTLLKVGGDCVHVYTLRRISRNLEGLGFGMHEGHVCQPLRPVKCWINVCQLLRGLKIGANGLGTRGSYFEFMLLSIGGFI